MKCLFLLSLLLLVGCSSSYEDYKRDYVFQKYSEECDFFFQDGCGLFEEHPEHSEWEKEAMDKFAGVEPVKPEYVFIKKDVEVDWINMRCFNGREFLNDSESGHYFYFNDNNYYGYQKYEVVKENVFFELLYPDFSINIAFPLNFTSCDLYLRLKIHTQKQGINYTETCRALTSERITSKDQFNYDGIIDDIDWWCFKGDI